MKVDEAWERDKHAVGRAVHEGWAAEKIKQGFADHAYRDCLAGPNCEDACLHRCSIPKDKHHTDMLDFDDLAPHIQEYDWQTGIIAYRMGYEAARREPADA